MLIAINELNGIKNSGFTVFKDEDIETQCKQIFKNNGMYVTEEELDGAIGSIKGAIYSAGSSIIIILIPVPGTETAGGYKLARLCASVLNAGANYHTYTGGASGLQTVYKYMEQYGFKRACQEGDINVMCTKTLNSQRIWDPWKTTSYINKYFLGDRGTIKTGITSQELIKECNWKKVS